MSLLSLPLDEELTIEDALRALEPVAGAMAGQYGGTEHWADARQEALIAAWQSLEAGKDLPLVRLNMRHAVMDVVLRGRRMTGNKYRPGVADTHRKYAVPLWKVDDNGEEYLVVEPEVASAEDEYLENVPDGGLLPHVQELSMRQQEAVALRHYGYTNREAAAILGISSGSFDNRIAAARKNLREKVAA